MIQKNTSTYQLSFYPNYVIVEAVEGAKVNNEIVAETLKLIFDHYKKTDFVLITNRKNNYSIDIDIYTVKLMKKLRALAVVSSDSLIKEKAMVEQLAFDQSFAFFENLDDAKGWAESVFPQ